jgi:competence protein ComEC
MASQNSESNGKALLDWQDFIASPNGRFLSFVLGFVGAVLLYYQRSEPLSWPILGLMATLTLILIPFKRYWWPYKTGHFYVGLIIGVQWAFWHAFFTPHLPQGVVERIGVNASEWVWQAEGEVASLPTFSMITSKTTGKVAEKETFLFKLSRLCGVSAKKFRAESAFCQNPQSCPDCTSFSSWQAPLIKVSLYQVDRLNEQPHAGERWRLTLRLKPVHGLQNPGGFDYEAVLWQQGVVAQGYSVRNGELVRLKMAPWWSVNAWRERLRTHWLAQWRQSPFKGLYLALLLGDRSYMSQMQRQTLQQTGTIHLMAISGLHVGIAAGLGALLFSGLWRLWIVWRRWRYQGRLGWAQTVPKWHFAVIGAIVAATLYTLMAGFSIPTQRAWLMVAAMGLMVLLNRPFQPWSALALAALFVVAWHPPSILSAGFWLSFVAVGLIFAVLFHPKIRPLKNWQKALWIQAVLTIGLAPLLAYYFHQLPVVSFAANVVAVPLVSLIGLPILMVSAALGGLVLGSGPSLMEKVWGLNDGFWQQLWWFLEGLQQSLPPITLGGLELWQVILIYLLAFTLLKFAMPWRNRIQLIVLIILVWSVPQWFRHHLPEKHAKVTVLDVGQGLAVVVETAKHVLIYDAGGRWNEKWDGANLAILPYLRHQGINEVDLLMVSHSDLDHAGGVERLAAQIPVKKILSGQPQKVAELAMLSEGRIQPCKAGQSWIWDGVSFEVFSPMPSTTTNNDNARSCVLKITAGNSNSGQSVWLMGDAGIRQERDLMKHFLPEQLKGDVLVAGHHGSATATSKAWLEAVQPQAVIYASGYQNRWHFPNAKVLERVQKFSIKQWDTACQGAIQWVLAPDNSPVTIQGWRTHNARWYHAQCKDLK